MYPNVKLIRGRKETDVRETKKIDNSKDKGKEKKESKREMDEKQIEAGIN